MSPEHAKKLGRLFVGGPAAWESYANEPDPDKRRRALNRIVSQNEPYIAKCVKALMARGLVSPLESVADLSFDDMLNAGRKGYVQALERYNPELGALPSFVRTWIRNAVQRAASKETTIYKSNAAKIPASALRVVQAIEAKEGRLATAEEMGITQRRYDNWKAQPIVISEDDTAAGHENITTKRHETPSDEPSPEAVYASKEVAYEVSILPDRERQVVTMLFWEDATIDQVADALHIHVDEAADLRDSALQTLHDSVR